jgi:hypothetical protein
VKSEIERCPLSKYYPQSPVENHKHNPKSRALNAETSASFKDMFALPGTDVDTSVISEITFFMKDCDMSAVDEAAIRCISYVVIATSMLPVRRIVESTTTAEAKNNG